MDEATVTDHILAIKAVLAMNQKTHTQRHIDWVVRHPEAALMLKSIGHQAKAILASAAKREKVTFDDLQDLSYFCLRAERVLGLNKGGPTTKAGKAPRVPRHKTFETLLTLLFAFLMSNLLASIYKFTYEGMVPGGRLHGNKFITWVDLKLRRLLDRAGVIVPYIGKLLALGAIRGLHPRAEQVGLWLQTLNIFDLAQRAGLHAVFKQVDVWRQPENLLGIPRPLRGISHMFCSLMSAYSLGLVTLASWKGTTHLQEGDQLYVPGFVNWAALVLTLISMSYGIHQLTVGFLSGVLAAPRRMARVVLGTLQK